MFRLPLSLLRYPPAFATHKYWPVFHAVLAFLLVALVNRPVFYGRYADGFSFGMWYITETPWSQLINDPLSIVQSLRVLLFYPLWIIRDTAWVSPLGSLGIICALWPIATRSLYLDRPVSPWRAALFYLPLVLSLRAVLVTVGLGYLLLIFFAPKPRNLLYFLSGLFVNLSSASVFLWVTASLLNWRCAERLRVMRYIIVAAMLVSVSVSIDSKFHYFSSIAGTTNVADHPSRMITTVVDRNTFITSLETRRYDRAACYVVVLAVLIFVLNITFRDALLRRHMFKFFIAGLPMFAMEGLGVVSLIAPLFIFLCEYYAFPHGKPYSPLGED